jgi:pimeloyl-ACP methyl ester carboxylesterase
MYSYQAAFRRARDTDCVEPRGGWPVKEEASILEVNGLRMHVVSAGQGPPVLLLHGFPDTHSVWRRQIGVLADGGFRVIAPDLRGCGKTDAPRAVRDYRLSLLWADVLALLEVLGIDQVRLVGHDWGAVIGWQICMVAPSRIDRFVALSVGHPAALAQSGLRQWLRLAYTLVLVLPGVAEQALKFGNWLCVRKFTRDRTQIGYWRRNLGRPGRLTAALNYYRANIGLALPHRWPSVSVPVMGIWSDGDPAMGEKQMRDSGRYVQAEFRYECLLGADHWLQLTAADRLNQLLLDYFGAKPKP